IMGRKLAEALQAKFGQPFVIENQGGASGNIAVETVVRSPADGYTLLIGTLGNLATNQFLFPDLKFNVARDLTPVTRAFGLDHIGRVTAKVPGQDIQGFIARGKENPGKVASASSGPRGAIHRFSVVFQLRTGTTMRHIPYKGSAAAVG